MTIILKDGSLASKPHWPFSWLCFSCISQSMWERYYHWLFKMSVSWEKKHKADCSGELSCLECRQIQNMRDIVLTRTLRNREYWQKERAKMGL